MNNNEAYLTGHIDKNGNAIRNHDKLKLIEGHNEWFTHVQFNKDNSGWHREKDYSLGEIVGNYLDRAMIRMMP